MSRAIDDETISVSSRFGKASHSGVRRRRKLRGTDAELLNGFAHLCPWRDQRLARRNLSSTAELISCEFPCRRLVPLQFGEEPTDCSLGAAPISGEKFVDFSDDVEILWRALAEIVCRAEALFYDSVLCPYFRRLARSRWMLWIRRRFPWGLCDFSASLRLRRRRQQSQTGLVRARLLRLLSSCQPVCL